MADWRQYFYGQKVTALELRAGFDGLERADRAIVGDLGLIGITSGGVVTQHSPTPDLTVDVTALKANDQQGRRVQFAAPQTVNLAVDSSAVSTNVTNPGQGKIISVFAKFKRALSDPRLDRNGDPVDFVQDESFEFVVVQGAEAVTPTPPALLSDGLLLADVTREFGDTQLLNADVSTTRRENAFKLAAGAMTVETGTPEASDAAILVHLNGHVTGVANVHAASTISYAGGGAWLNGVTNPAATTEAQLDKIVVDLTNIGTGVSGAAAIGFATGTASWRGGGDFLDAGTVFDAINEIVETLADDGGAIRIGIGDRTAWLGGRTNPGNVSVLAAVDKIITDLAVQAAGDDGAERIGAQAVAGSYAAGSVRSQLGEIITAAQTVTGVKTFDANVQLEPTRALVFSTAGTPTVRNASITGPMFGFDAATGLWKMFDNDSGSDIAPGEVWVAQLPDAISHGDTLQTIYWAIDPVVATAATRFRVALVRKQNTTAAPSAVWTHEDSLTSGSYTAPHTYTYGGTPHVLDRVGYAYYLLIYGEDSGTPGNVRLQGPPLLEYTVSQANLLGGGG